MADEGKYKIHYCWNGSKRQIEWTDTFNSRREWEFEVEGLPYDFIDDNDTTIWVDYGDNDE